MILQSKQHNLVGSKCERTGCAARRTVANRDSQHKLAGVTTSKPENSVFRMCRPGDKKIPSNSYLLENSLP